MITRSRLKAAGDLFLGLINFMGFVWAYEWVLSHIQAWSHVLIPLFPVAIVGWSLWAIIAFIEIVKPPRLILDSQGITRRSLFRPHTISWRDVHNFRLVRIGWGSFIGFDHVRPRAVDPILRALNRGAGIPSSLGSGWAMEGERLVALLNAGRHLWGDAPQRG